MLTSGVEDIRDDIVSGSFSRSDSLRIERGIEHLARQSLSSSWRTR